jgi:hypothetical protein
MTAGLVWSNVQMVESWYDKPHALMHRYANQCDSERQTSLVHHKQIEIADNKRWQSLWLVFSRQNSIISIPSTMNNK